MTRSLRDTLLEGGSVVDGATSRPLHFGDPEAEFQAALHRAVLVDRSELARLIAGGPDILGLLHRLSTADLKALPAGSGRPTVLTSAKGRIVERLFVHHLGAQGVLLVGGSAATSTVTGHLERFTFAEQTGIADIAAQTALLAVSGPLARDAASATGFPLPEPLGNMTASFGDAPIHVLGHDGTSSEGLAFLVPAKRAAALWKVLFLALGKVDGLPTGDEPFESARIVRGFPAAGHELTEEHNPLEAGLIDAVSFDKGCYVGQEVVARLHNYDKVARAIFGLAFAPRAALPGIGDALYIGGRAVGVISSATIPPGWDRPVALAYVKRRDAEVGSEVRVADPENGASARLVDPAQPRPAEGP